MYLTSRHTGQSSLSQSKITQPTWANDRNIRRNVLFEGKMKNGGKQNTNSKRLNWRNRGNCGFKMLAETWNKTRNSQRTSDSQSLLKNEQVEMNPSPFVNLINKIKPILDANGAVLSRSAGSTKVRHRRTWLTTGRDQTTFTHAEQQRLKCQCQGFQTSNTWRELSTWNHKLNIAADR